MNVVYNFVPYRIIAIAREDQFSIIFVWHKIDFSDIGFWDEHTKPRQNSPKGNFDLMNVVYNFVPYRIIAIAREDQF